MKKLRILAMEGPGDVLGTFSRWCEGKSDERITHRAFSGQFFDVCRNFGAEALVVTSRSEPGELVSQGITVRNGGDALANQHGVRYHLTQLGMAQKIARMAREFDADVAIIGAVPHPFFVAPLLPSKIKTAFVLHGVLWPKYRPMKVSTRAIRSLYVPFLRSGCDAIMCVSAEIKRQIDGMAGPNHAPFVDFLPSFDAGTFDSVPQPSVEMPHRVLFIGRIEINKGVFDLLELAIRLRAADRRIEFDLCGSGTAMDELQRRVTDAQIGDRFHLHGWCNQEQIKQHFGRSTVVIVPTTTEFTEGFNMVVVEALLAGRPVITSDVCPALEYVRGAVREVPPDDVDAYYKALLELVDDRATYERLQSQCRVVTQRFLDPHTSFAAAFSHFLEAASEGKRPDPLIHTP